MPVNCEFAATLLLELAPQVALALALVRPLLWLDGAVTCAWLTSNVCGACGPRGTFNDLGRLVLYAAGGRDMQNSTLHDYATTGLRRWSLEKLVEWELL